MGCCCSIQSSIVTANDFVDSSKFVISEGEIETIYFIPQGESVRHYYHFLFGALFPLLEYHLTTGKYVFKVGSDIGPFKRIVCEMPFHISEISGSETIMPSGASNVRPTVNTTKSANTEDDRILVQNEVLLPAYDCFGLPDYLDDTVEKLSKRSLRSIVAYLSQHIPRYLTKNISQPSIILVERAVETYYSQVPSPHSAVDRTSGSQRRKIRNHTDLVAALAYRFGSSFVNVTLEKSSLYYQIHLFTSLKVVIAQHGSALSNIVFMSRPNAKVIEILPPCGRSTGRFKNLSAYCGLDYVEVLQEKDDSDVDIDTVINLAERAMIG
jgi:hypothetical protein